MERSWKPLGALLDGSRAEKTKLESALGRSTRPLEIGFNYLGCQNVAQEGLKTFQNQVQKATQAGKRKTLKFNECLTKSVDFSDPRGPILGVKNR